MCDELIKKVDAFFRRRKCFRPGSAFVLVVCFKGPVILTLRTMKESAAWTEQGPKLSRCHCCGHNREGGHPPLKFNSPRKTSLEKIDKNLRYYLSVTHPIMVRMKCFEKEKEIRSTSISCQ